MVADRVLLKSASSRRSASVLVAVGFGWGPKKATGTAFLLTTMVVSGQRTASATNSMSVRFRTAWRSTIYAANMLASIQTT